MEVIFKMMLSEFPFSEDAMRNAAKFTKEGLDKMGERYMEEYFRYPYRPTAEEIDNNMNENPGMMAELIGMHWDMRNDRPYTTDEEWAADRMRALYEGDPHVEEFIASGFGDWLEECEDDEELQEQYYEWLATRV